MAREYIERRGAYYYFIGEPRVSGFGGLPVLRGESPEGIAQAFPSLRLFRSMVESRFI